MRFFIKDGGLTGATLTLHQATPLSASPPTNPLEADGRAVFLQAMLLPAAAKHSGGTLCRDDAFPAQMAIEGRPLLPKKRHFTPMFCLIFN